MQNIYRETFEQIHASEQLRKEVANVPKQEKAAASGTWPVGP